MSKFSSFGARAYAKVDIESKVNSSDSYTLVLMLFDGALNNLARAKASMIKKDIADKGECISRLIQIVDDGLRASLDLSSGGEMAQRLHDLYEYICQRALLASIRNDISMLDEIFSLLTELRGAWAMIGNKSPSINHDANESNSKETEHA